MRFRAFVMLCSFVFVLGLFAGTNLGVLIMCVLQVASPPKEVK